MEKEKFVTISESKTEVVKAIKTSIGVLVKATNKSMKSESMYHVNGGVLINHGTEDAPDWKLNF
jgi:acyl-CoA hydrolase